MIRRLAVSQRISFAIQKGIVASLHYAPRVRIKDFRTLILATNSRTIFFQSRAISYMINDFQCNNNFSITIALVMEPMRKVRYLKLVLPGPAHVAASALDHTGQINVK